MRRRRFPYTARQIIEHLAKQSAPWSSHDFVKHLPLATLTQWQRKLWALSDLAQINKVAQDLYQANASDRAKAIPAANQMPLMADKYYAEVSPKTGNFGFLMPADHVEAAIQSGGLQAGCVLAEFELKGKRTLAVRHVVDLVPVEE